MAAAKKIAKEMIVICKYTVKSNGAVIYRMRSNIPNKLGRIEGLDQVERNGEWFDVYMVSSDGEYVCGCMTSGEQCKGSRYRGKCCHRDHAQMLLDAAKAPKLASVVEAPKVETKITDISTKGNFGSKGFSILKSAS